MSWTSSKPPESADATLRALYERMNAIVGMIAVDEVAVAQQALDRGEMRVAEPVDGEWRVNEEAQRAILAYFRLRELEPREAGPFETHAREGLAQPT